MQLVLVHIVTKCNIHVVDTRQQLHRLQTIVVQSTVRQLLLSFPGQNDEAARSNIGNGYHNKKNSNQTEMIFNDCGTTISRHTWPIVVTNDI